MKLTPERILSPQAPQVVLLSLLTVATAALWWLWGGEAVAFKVSKMLLYLVAALVVSWLMFAAKLTRMFEFTPAVAAFLSLVCIDFTIYANTPAVWQTYFSAVVITIILLCIMNVTRRLWKADRTSEEMFVITLLLTLGAFLCPPVLALIVVVWLVFIVLKSFSFKTLLASLIAIACVAILTCVAFHLFLPDGTAQNLLDQVIALGDNVRHLAVLNGMPMAHVVLASVFGVLIIGNIVCHQVSHYRDDQYTRVLLNTWSVFAIALLLLFLTFGTSLLLMPLAVLVLMLQLHSTALRPSWYVFVLWLIYVGALLLLPLSAGATYNFSALI